MLKREVFAIDKKGKDIKTRDKLGNVTRNKNKCEEFFKNTATLKDVNLLNLSSEQLILKFT
jgi:hypothetical protein